MPESKDLNAMTRDEHWMRAALRQARRAVGFTSPNPPVGAVVVRRGEVVGRGCTQPPGGPHAEVVALAEAGARARGATLYVTLEPCAHFGRTPPCTNAVLQAGIARVVAALEDPHDVVAGRGFARLREAGLQVSVGVCEAGARCCSLTSSTCAQACPTASEVRCVAGWEDCHANRRPRAG